ncbi:MAG TPA: SusD/RagB family nutrient-binding outer membrane lipoprotein, partial [Gemmatirosa sp.]
MHNAEVSQTVYGSPTAAYDSVLKYGSLGIQSTADDFLTYHAASPTGSNNVWVQFQGARGDLGPGAAIINLMTSRIKAGLDTSTDRLAYYFSDACGGDGTDPGNYGGFRPGSNTALPGGQGAPNCAGGYSDFDAFGDLAISDLRNPVVTYAETQLLLAEASYQKAGGGAAGVAAAQPYLNNVRANETYGATAAGTTTFASEPTVPATLDNIIQEKYIDLFGSLEVWNDYKRTCLPPLAGAPTNTSTTQVRSAIPGRLPYGISEINANTSTPNVPANGRNANDPNACPSYTYPTAF